MNKPKPCPECTKYDICLTLCPPIEAWVSQDHSKLSGWEHTTDPAKIDTLTHNDLTEYEDAAETKKKERMFHMYFWEHKTLEEIGSHFRVTKRYVKKICDDKLEIIANTHKK